MITLIYGASSSGKSEYAEKLLIESNAYNKLYLATMKNAPENADRINRHRQLREGKGFITIECDRNIIEIISDNNINVNNNYYSCKDCTILLECLSNLTANEMFLDGEIISKEIVKNKIINEIKYLNKKINNLIIVTNNIFDDGIIYDDITSEYIKALSEINKNLAKAADNVIEVVVGIPVKLK